MKSIFFTVIGIASATFLFAQQGEAHGNHFSIDKQVNGNTVELSYDNLEINTTESFDFHTSLIQGAGTSEWDFVPYDSIKFEMRQSDKTLYTKTFHSGALGFGTYTFQEGGDYDLFIRFMSGSSLVLETSFPIQVKDTGPAIEYGRTKQDGSGFRPEMILGISFLILGTIGIGWYFIRRRKTS